MLKNAVTITKTALIWGQYGVPPGAPMGGMDAMDPLRNFNTVGANILDRRRPDRPGYQCQVGQSMKALMMTPQHQAVPILACARTEQDFLAIIRDDLPALYSHHNRRARQRVVEDDVTPLPQYADNAVLRRVSEQTI